MNFMLWCWGGVSRYPWLWDRMEFGLGKDGQEFVSGLVWYVILSLIFRDVFLIGQGLSKDAPETKSYMVKDEQSVFLPVIK